MEIVRHCGRGVVWLQSGAWCIWCLVAY